MDSKSVGASCVFSKIYCTVQYGTIGMMYVQQQAGREWKRGGGEMDLLWKWRMTRVIVYISLLQELDPCLFKGGIHWSKFNCCLGCVMLYAHTMTWLYYQRYQEYWWEEEISLFQLPRHSSTRGLFYYREYFFISLTRSGASQRQKKNGTWLPQLFRDFPHFLFCRMVGISFIVLPPFHWKQLVQGRTFSILS
jgi:hypothetical protein